MQMLSRFALRSWIAAATTAVSLAVVPAAFAAQESAHPTTDAPGRHVAGCDDAGLQGSLLDAGDWTASKSQPDGRYLTLRAVSDGIRITGIVIEGGGAYNLYVPGKRGMAAQAPWQRMHAPDDGAAKPPVITHWFACGIAAAETSSAPAPAAEGVMPAKRSPMTKESRTSTTKRTRDTSSASASAAAQRGVRLTSAPPARSAASPSSATTEVLAYTGFGARGLVPFGLALVLAGSAVLVLLRSRGRRR